MATRFAVASGNWSNTAIWDGGILPASTDDVYTNNYTVTLDQDITIASLRNTASDVYLPGMPIPLMTGNTQPSGNVFAGQNTSTAYQAFDYSSSTLWQSTNLTNCTIGYQFTSGKIIKRYYLFRSNENQRPITWTFEGSNDGTTYSVLETVTSNTANTPYLSGILANTTSYTFYRINITAVSSGTVANVRSLEMTESTGTVYGTITGGSLTIPSSLSGTRNVVFTGDGLRALSATALVLVSNLSGSTVNFNVQSGGYIINVNWLQSAGNFLKGFELNGTGAVNFNSNLYGQTNGNHCDSGGAIHVNGTPTITINGNIYGGVGSASLITTFIFFKAATSNSAVLNHNGDNIAGSSNSPFYNIYIASNAIINITGNLTGNVGSCLTSSSTSSSTISLTGTATVTNLNSQPAITLTSLSSLLTINGSITNKGNVNAILAAKIRFVSTATPYWIYQTNAGTDMTLAYGSATGAYPAEADVRFGVTYAASPTRYGTLRVPLPQYVSQGVLTDNTTGTAYLSATDVWNVLTSNITTSGSIGERLKNASTVQTNGDQLAAYIV